MPTNNDVVALQMERVRSKLQDIFETSSTVSGMIKRGAEVEKISTRDYRIPLVMANGGDYRKYDSDGGDMGRGSGMETAPMISTYFSTLIAFELTNLQMFATATSEIAVAKVFARTLSNAIKEFQVYDDYAWHGDGTGVVATATAQTTTSGNTVYTLDTVNGAQLLRRKMNVQVYSSDLGTQRTGGPYRILSVDQGAGKVTLTGTVPSAAATDKLVFDGVSGANPTWKHGLYYFNSSTTSGNLLSLSKTTYPELVSNYVSAAGPLAAAHGLFLLDQIVQRRDELGDLMGIAHQKQRTAWFMLGMQISEWQRGKSDEMIDIVPSAGDGLKKFRFCGVDHVVDKHQNRQRIDWIRKNQWGRAVLADLDYHTVEGRKLFELRGTSGGVAAGMLFYLRQLEDWYNVDPGGMGYMDGLSIPSV